MSFGRTFTALILEFLETAALALLFFAIMYVFAFQPYEVKGNSMFPTYHDGEYMLINKLVYRLSEPKRGEVIVFNAPDNERYDYIKRIIGMPGDKIKITQNKLYVNGQMINENTYLSSDVITSPGYYLRENQEIVIPPNNYFVMGDNRTNSSDSRDFGPLPKQKIVGMSWLMYWPMSKLRIIKQTSYLLP
jgi:signal peptidase I